MPVLQLSVEWLFSALKLWKSDLRNKLKEDIIGNALMLRANLSGIGTDLEKNIKVCKRPPGFGSALDHFGGTIHIHIQLLRINITLQLSIFSNCSILVYLLV